jgi:hypothetical protein
MNFHAKHEEDEAERLIPVQMNYAFAAGWTALKEAHRLDAADRDIFDDSHSFPHCALLSATLG